MITTINEWKQFNESISYKTKPIFTINQPVYVHDWNGDYHNARISKINNDGDDLIYFVILDGDSKEYEWAGGEISAIQFVYHFTTIKHLIEIINSNTLKQFNNAISFTVDSDLWVFKQFDDGQEIDVRLMFDIKDLPLIYEYDDSMPGENLSHEKEFRSTSGDITNIVKKIVKITTSKSNQEYLKTYLPNNVYKIVNFE